jgi:4-hydroxyacetophenone monooxygenase
VKEWEAPVGPERSEPEISRRHLDGVEAVPLLAAVVCLTGDFALLREDFCPPLVGNRGDSGAQDSAIRDACWEAVRRNGGRSQRIASSLEWRELFRILEFLIGKEEAIRYGPLLLEEMALEDLRQPNWTMSEIAPGREIKVGIIGAGLSGILAAHRLQQIGASVTIFEKNQGIGGTWFDNVYPGCRVDVPSQLYCYSCLPSESSHKFATQSEIKQYLQHAAAEFGVLDLIRFRTEIIGAAFSEQGHPWQLIAESTEDHRRATFDCDFVVSAVGQLNRPAVPGIDGLDRFKGAMFHSATWNSSASLSGSVGVIGTGASAMQLIPQIAEQTSELTIFQRSPSWMLPTPGYHDRIDNSERLVQKALPTFRAWLRLWLFWETHEGLSPATVVDPEWNSPHSISGDNDSLRRALTAYIERQFPNRPDLLDQVVPSYPPLAKRAIRDNGSWAQTLDLPHVRLTTRSIQEITPDGVLLDSGEEVLLDTLILATGFEASNFLAPMEIRGREKLNLREYWGGDASAYLGLMVPQFPNLFCLYGPNTNIVINGSVVFFTECEVNYLLNAIRHVVAEGRRTVEVTEPALERFSQWVDEGNRARAWGIPEISNWYKSKTGRVSQNWPYSLLEYWERSRRIDLDDVVLA